MTEFYLHVGCHKTGTKFFQHMVFNQWAINNDKLIYNPSKLTQLICDLMKAKIEDERDLYQAINKEKKRISDNYPDKKILISREIMSGNLFSFYSDFDLTFRKIKTSFPEASIIIYTRNCFDWLVSCYRESIHEHHYQSFEEFIGLKKRRTNFAGGSFKNLNFKKIIDFYKGEYKERVFIGTFENFKKEKENEVKKVAAFIGINNYSYNKTEVIPNRGYSKLAIKLSILRFKVFNSLGLSHIFIHRPIFFFGENSIPAGFESLSELPLEKYWHDGFFRDNEEVRSNNWPNVTFLEKFTMFFSWRYFVKNVFDKIYYNNKPIVSNQTEHILREFFKD